MLVEKGRSRGPKPLGRLADVAVDGFQPRETETSARVTRLGKKASTRAEVQQCHVRTHPVQVRLCSNKSDY